MPEITLSIDIANVLFTLGGAFAVIVSYAITKVMEQGFEKSKSGKVAILAIVIIPVTVIFIAISIVTNL